MSKGRKWSSKIFMCSIYFHNLSISDKMNCLQIITTQVLVSNGNVQTSESRDFWRNVRFNACLKSKGDQLDLWLFDK